MNKKILIISLAAIFLIILISSIVFADSINKISQKTKELNLKDTVNIDDTYIKLDSKNTKGTNSMNKENEIAKIKVADKYLETFKLTNKKINTANTTVEVYKNNLNNITEAVISNSDMIVTLNNDTGELISYINNKTSFEKNTLSKASVQTKALEILKNIDNSNEYELISLEQFDEEIYQAKFGKRYGKYINPGELISFSFAPQTSEIVTFAQKSVPFANNEVKLSEEDARKIVQDYLEKSTATEISSISLEIVQPNYALNEKLENGNLYKNPNQTRLAYVCNFNNSAQTKIYIDCTTGEAIGADLLLGGDF